METTLIGSDAVSPTVEIGQLHRRFLTARSLLNRQHANRLKLSAAVCAIAAMTVFGATPAQAACDDNDPDNGETVTCTSTAPNPDEGGVGDGPTSLDITVNIEDGAIVSNGNLSGRAAISLGGGATITSAAGSEIRGGIRIQGAGNSLDLGGDVDNIVLTGSTSILTLQSTAMMQGSIVPNVISLTGDDSDVTLDGDIISTGNSGFPTGAVNSSGEDVQIIVGEEGSITADGDNVSGILALGDENRVGIAGSVAVSGDGVAGIVLNNGINGVVVVAEGASVTATGAGSVGISAFRPAGSTGGGFGISHRINVQGSLSAADGPAIVFNNGGTVTVGGTISGGNGVAVDFATGDFSDSFEINPGFMVQGLVDAEGGFDTFKFSGNAGEAGTFDVGLLETQYLNFDGLNRDGSATSSWTLTGSTNFTGNFRTGVGQNILDNAQLPNVNFEISSGTSIATVFSGQGTIRNLEIEDAILSPGGVGGSEFGTIATEQLILREDSTLLVNVNAAGDSDLLDVTGRVFLRDGTLDVNEIDDFTGANPFTYTIIANDGTDVVDGTFGTITNDLAFLSPSVDYAGGDGNDVILSLTPNSGAGGCAPAAADGVDALCTGTIDNQNDPNGYGTGIENNVTVEVGTAAMLSGTTNGMFLGTDADITTAGDSSTSGGVSGIRLAGSGEITAETDSAISGVAAGVLLDLGGTVSNAGMITAAGDFADHAAIVSTSGTFILSNTGTLSGTGIAGNGIQVAAGTLRGSNNGSITGNRTGIFVANGNITNFANSGTIDAASGTPNPGNAIAVGTGGITDLTNTGTGLITGAIDGVAINSGNLTNMRNSGIVRAAGNAADNGAVKVATGFLDVINLSGGLIEATGTLGAALITENGNLNLNNGGTVRANSVAVRAVNGFLDVRNSGTIESSTNTAISVLGGAGVVSTSGTITGGNGVAVLFDPTGNFNDTFQPQVGAVTTGTVDAGAGTDTFLFGTAENLGVGTFDVTLLDTQYLNFEQLRAEAINVPWTLTGSNNIFDGTFAIQGGRIIFDSASLALVDTTVSRSGFGTRGRLSGSGTVGAMIISDGNLSPGTDANPFGTFTMSSFSTIFASIIELDVNDEGMADKLIVNGPVMLDGGILDVTASGAFSGSDPFNYLIIDNDATDAVDGTFDTIETNLAFLTPSVSYTAGDGNDVQLILTPNGTSADGCMLGAGSPPPIVCSADDSDGIEQTGDIASITVGTDVTVSGTADGAIQVNSPTPATPSSRITGDIVNDGVVQGLGSADGFRINGILEGQVRNTGTIDGAAAGFRLTSLFSTQNNDLINSGTISGGSDAGIVVNGQFDGSFVQSEVTIVNEGTIESATREAISLTGEGYSPYIINEGTITGGAGQAVVFSPDISTRFEIWAGSSVVGTVGGGLGGNTLILGGDSDGSFDIGTVDADGTADSDDQYLNFRQLNKTGSSSWTLTGTNDEFILMSLSDGTLINNADLPMALIRSTSGDNKRLAGTGSFGNIELFGGTLAPGNSIGTMTTGNLQLTSDTTLEIEVDDAGNSDLLIVNGTVRLGGTLSVLESGSFGGTDPFNYLIIDNDAADAVLGTFGTIQNDFAFLDAMVSYDAGDGNDVQLTLTPNNTPPPPPPPPGCTPPAANGVNAVCSGIVNEQNAPNGYGTGIETDVALLIDETAVIVASGIGVFLNDSATVTTEAGSRIESSMGGIVVGTGGSITHAGSTITAAENAPGISIANSTSATLELLTGASISTEGAGSDAVNIGMGTNVTGSATITGSTLSTMSDGARGLVFGEGGGENSSRVLNMTASDIGTEGANATGLVLGALGNGSVSTTALSQVTITTAGIGSRGIADDLIGGGSAVETTLTNVTISTTGASDAAAYLAEGTVDNDSALSFNATNIDFSTQGTDSPALFHGGGGFDSSVFAFDIEGGSFSTIGTNSEGFRIDQFLASDESSTAGSINTITIDTMGDGSHGIWLGTSGDGAMEVSSTAFAGRDITITTQGDGAHGFVFEGAAGAVTTSDATFLLTEVDIVTAGDFAQGLIIGDIGTTISDSSTILVMSLDRVQTSGADAPAVSIGANWDVGLDGDRALTVEILGAVEATGANGVAFVSDSALLISHGGTLTGASGVAVDLRSGGDDEFQLWAGAVVNGNVLAGGGDDVFVLGGESGSDSFDSALIGTQYLDFEIFEKTGASIWTLTGDTAFSNQFTMRGGTLLANGEFGAMAFDVLGGATLGGTGTVGAVTSIGGIVAPGNSIGTLTVNGDLSFDTNSIFNVEVDDLGNSDLVMVTGTVTLGGATLDVDETGSFAGTDPFNYLIIDNDAADAVNGTFGTVQNDFAFLDAMVSYDAGDGNDVQLTLTPNNAPPSPPTSGTGLFPTVATTVNQTNSAIRLDELDRTNADADDVYMAVLFTTTPQALEAFDTASGEIYATLLASRAKRGLSRTNRLLARANEQSEEGWGIWGGAYGRTGSTDGDGNAAEADDDGRGAELGIDYRGPDNGWAMGASVTWNDGALNIAQRQSKADSGGWSLGGYGRYGSGHAGFTLSAAVDYSASEADVTRDITIANLSRSASGVADYDSFAVSAEARYGFGPADKGWVFGPIASIAHSTANFDGVAETGAGALNLSGSDASVDLMRYGGGLFANWQGERGGFDVSAQYVIGSSEFALVTLTLEGSPDIARPVRSPVTDGNGALIGASGHVDLGGNWTLSAETRALVGSDSDELAGSVSVGWRF